MDLVQSVKPLTAEAAESSTESAGKSTGTVGSGQVSVLRTAERLRNGWERYGGVDGLGILLDSGNSVGDRPGDVLNVTEGRGGNIVDSLDLAWERYGGVDCLVLGWRSWLGDGLGVGDGSVDGGWSGVDDRRDHGYRGLSDRLVLGLGGQGYRWNRDRITDGLYNRCGGSDVGGRGDVLRWQLDRRVDNLWWESYWWGRDGNDISNGLYNRYSCSLDICRSLGNRRKCYGIVDGLRWNNLGRKGNGANITNGLDNRSSLDEGSGVGGNDRRLGDRTVLDTWRLSRSRYGEGVGLGYSLVHRNGLRVR